MEAQRTPLWRLVSEWLVRVFHHWVLLVAGIIGVALTVVSVILTLGHNSDAQTWAKIGVTLFVVAFVVGQFLAWKDMRQERDHAAAELAEMQERLSGRSLEISGLELRIDYGAGGLQIGVQFHNYGAAVVRYSVQQVDVAIAGKSPDPSVPVERGMSWADVPPGGHDVLTLPAISGLDLGGPELQGALWCTVHYGHPDLAMTRWLYEKRRLHFSGRPIAEVRSVRLEGGDDPIR